MKKYQKIAPIILFTYRRLETLKKAIFFLKKNKLYKNSEIIIFSDGYKNTTDKNDVLEVRKYLKSINGFKKKRVIFRKKNIGLAKNITNGISSVFKKFDRAIILEDDIIVSPNFLDYMNFYLNEFKYNKKIWHINGWNYNFNFQNKSKRFFFTRGMICWGWGTWKDRWNKYNNKSKYFLKNWDKRKVYEFNYENSTNHWLQLLRNHEKKIQTWAIFWYATIYDNGGLCLSPFESLSFNVGFDKYSTHQPNQENSFENLNKSFFKRNNIQFKTFNTVNEDKEVYRIIKNNLKRKKYSEIIKSLISKSF